MPPSIDTGETEKKVVSTAEELPVNAPPLNLNEIVTEKDSKASDQGKNDSNQIQSETAPSLAEAQTEKNEVQIIDEGTLIKEENGVEKQDGKKQKRDIQVCTDSPSPDHPGPEKPGRRSKTGRSIQSLPYVAANLFPYENSMIIDHDKRERTKKVKATTRSTTIIPANYC